MWEKPLLKWQELRRLYLLNHSRITQVFLMSSVLNPPNRNSPPPHKKWSDGCYESLLPSGIHLFMFHQHICITEDPSMIKKESDERWHMLILEGSMHIAVMLLPFSWLWNLSGIKETRVGYSKPLLDTHNHKRKQIFIPHKKFSSVLKSLEV